MEKKRKQDHKVSSNITSHDEPETDQLILRKDDQNQGNAEHLTKSSNAESHSNGNVPSSSHLCPVSFPWPYMPQQSTVMPRPFVEPQSPMPGSISQWTQFPHQVQYGQPPRTYPQSAVPFWLPQPPGYPLPASNAQSPYVAVQASDVSGGTSTTNQPYVSNLYYHAGYPYSGFPGSCDPSSWWSRAQASQPQCTNAFLGSSPAVSQPSCSTALGKTVGEGIIRPPAKISNKHQQLWDAQSAENLKLWSAVNHLQSEVSDYKNRVARLEAEVYALKAVAEGTTTQGSGVVAKPVKRGRPKKPVALVDPMQPPDKPPRRACGRRPAALMACNSERIDTKSHLFEKVILEKVENKEKMVDLIANIAAPTVCDGQKFDSKSHLFEKVILNKVENKEKMLDLMANVEKGNHVIGHSYLGNNQISSPMPAVQYQFQQKLPSILNANGSSEPSEMKEADIKANNCKTTDPVFSPNIPWSYINTSDFEGNVPHIGHDDLCNSGIAITDGEELKRSSLDGVR